ncbi:hypothetical protein MRX96_009558 [Rhipicephalus microplus]
MMLLFTHHRRAAAAGSSLFSAGPKRGPPRGCYRDSVRSSLHDEEMVGLRCEWERKTDKKFHQNQLRIQQERQQELADKQLHDRRHRLMQVLESVSSAAILKINFHSSSKTNGTNQ